MNFFSIFLDDAKEFDEQCKEFSGKCKNRRHDAAVQEHGRQTGCQTRSFRRYGYFEGGESQFRNFRSSLIRKRKYFYLCTEIFLIQYFHWNDPKNRTSLTIKDYKHSSQIVFECTIICEYLMQEYFKLFL